MDLIQDNPCRVRNLKMGTSGLQIASFTALDNFISKYFNPSKAEFKPICHFLALLRARPIFHVSRVRVNLTSLRILRSSCASRCATGVIGVQLFVTA